MNDRIMFVNSVKVIFEFTKEKTIYSLIVYNVTRYIYRLHLQNIFIMNNEKTKKDLTDKKTTNNAKSKKLQRQKKIDKFFDKLEIFFTKTKNILIKMC